MEKNADSATNNKDITKKGYDFKYAELTSKIIRCSMNVHNTLGNGFPEKFYQKAMELELTDAGLAFEREFTMKVFYKDHLLGIRRVDFLVEKIVGLELKAVLDLEAKWLAQGINYLEAYNLEVGLLINFGSPSLQFKRLLNRKFKASK